VKSSGRAAVLVAWPKINQARNTTMTATATTNQGTTNTNGKIRAAVTPVDAISRISKILNQLSPNDRKRVLAFVNESSE
jgi:hypothetical protein